VPDFITGIARIFTRDIGMSIRESMFLSAVLTLNRPLTGSWSQSIESMFRWHNETSVSLLKTVCQTLSVSLILFPVNIHSHSIGAIIFSFFLPLHFYFALYRSVPAAQPIDAAVFLLYFAGVTSCFAVSAALVTSQHERDLAQADELQIPYCRKPQSSCAQEV
jgi:predicted membrane channel-forming protein YqfA (hemolysin III family)